jgi:hypothetical protein
MINWLKRYLIYRLNSLSEPVLSKTEVERAGERILTDI